MSDAVTASAALWREALRFLEVELGFELHTRTVTDRGYRLHYVRDRVGVTVAYQVLDPATVTVSRLGEEGPEQIDERVDLHDLEAVAGRATTPTVWSVPDAGAVDAFARSLRAERAVLLGDFAALEAAAELVRARRSGALGKESS